MLEVSFQKKKNNVDGNKIILITDICLHITNFKVLIRK